MMKKWIYSRISGQPTIKCDLVGGGLPTDELSRRFRWFQDGGFMRVSLSQPTLLLGVIASPGGAWQSPEWECKDAWCKVMAVTFGDRVPLTFGSGTMSGPPCPRSAAERDRDILAMTKEEM